jgi:hypothetical protein
MRYHIIYRKNVNLNKDFNFPKANVATAVQSTKLETK